jgi:hypothetical protein
MGRKSKDGGKALLEMDAGLAELYESVERCKLRMSPGRTQRCLIRLPPMGRKSCYVLLVTTSPDGAKVESWATWYDFPLWGESRVMGYLVRFMTVQSALHAAQTLEAFCKLAFVQPTGSRCRASSLDCHGLHVHAALYAVWTMEAFWLLGLVQPTGSRCRA